MLLDKWVCEGSGQVTLVADCCMLVLELELGARVWCSQPVLVLVAC
jgi:hypothetical protein